MADRVGKVVGLARVDKDVELALIAQEIGAEVIRGPVHHLDGRQGEWNSPLSCSVS